MTEENTNPVSEAPVNEAPAKEAPVAEEQVQGEIDLDTLDDASLAALIAQGDADAEESDDPEETDVAEATTNEAPEAEEAPVEKPQSKQPEIDLEAVIAKQDKALKQQESFIQARNREVGELKKQLLATKAELKAALPNMMAEDPEKGLDIRDKIKEIDDSIAENDAELEAMTREHVAQRTFASYVKPGEVELEEMVQVLKDDGLDAGFIQQFAANPFSQAHPETLVHIAKRAKAEKYLKIVAKAYMELQKQVQKNTAKPSATMARIDKVANKIPRLTASQATGAKRSELSGDPGKWSQAELSAYLKAQTQRA